jgi:stalled ribosome rescue protein Dom34
MKKGTGLWIDHNKAVIVVLDDNGEQTKRIESEMEKHVRFSGGAQKDSEEDIRDRRFSNQLNNYYDEVISSIPDIQSILVFGPGEAKVEFKKRLENKKIKNCLIHIETVDKMTDNQIAAKVRQHFQE